MPPTSSPWSKALEAFGSIGFARAAPVRLTRIGEPTNATDAAGSRDWVAFCDARKLFAAWSPPDASPWANYAKPTLFAALDAYRGPTPGTGPGPEPQGALAKLRGGASPGTAGIGPRAAHGLDERPSSPPRLPPATAVMVDLPGPASAAYGAWLARAGFEPVPVWNNWPHPNGLVDMDRVLAAALHYVPWLARDRVRGPKAPPVFLLDRDRLGVRNPVPLEFDNRYFHLDADFPSAATFRRNGITQLVYVGPERDPPAPAGSPPSPGPPAGAGASSAPNRPTASSPVEPDDMNRTLVELAKHITVLRGTASLQGFALAVGERYAPAPRKTAFSTVRDPAFLGFKRAAAGGFGKLVPEPSSGAG